VLFDVAVAKPVVEEMAPDFGAKDPNHWSKVKEYGGSVAEEIWRWLDELGD
jgi:hypothetical protein